MFLICLWFTGNSQQKSFYGLYTDRDAYVSGETLLAKIFLPEGISSSIVCLDLMNLNGTRITGASLAIENNEAQGYLQLPDSLSSGTYLVRTYQKHNASKIKTIREIWISSRFDGLEKINQIKRIAASTSIQDKETIQIGITGIEPEYQTNSSFEANIKIDDSLLKELDGSLLVCVAQTDQTFNPLTLSMENNQSTDGIIEKKGIIISGTITDKRTLEPESGITVCLTIPDTIPGFQYYITRKDGRFYFLLDQYYGSVQAVIQCFTNNSTQRLNMKLDELFADPGILPEFRSQPITDDFKNNMTRNIAAGTFRKVFGQEILTFSAPPKKTRDSYPYYGKASQTVDPQLFFELPNFTEISRELLPGVKFRNYNNEPTLQVLNNSAHIYFEDKPLILIDGIPVRDLNIIKGMGTADIDRVDICQSERFFGDLRFPGVVAIYTTKADYSMLPESSQLARLKLETIQLQTKLAEPSVTEPNIPDLRQLLYWNPTTQPNPNMTVQCRTSAIEGQFKIQVRGKLKDGTLLFSEKNFEVK
jgi:hypothetical protein